ncbi:Uncharacterised protein [Neisseria animaloris]|uniref:hypothetical protein n=1 Tax=Neisseria animaloris TaxID=326522 RepID=UPI000A18A73D|nr:hypothetical protein [Neisseria animaloris]OSI07419.1 hypothetical protein BWD08_07695 [Neisseria animaloris]VEH87809.1 Uncharacterised protein [Neisseria animaloris]
MENESKPAGSKRMEVLQQSLTKKQTAFDNKLQAHFDDVQSANGQPLNDKRNGQATMNRWKKPSEIAQTAFSNGMSEQSTQGSLNVLKHLYLMQTATLSAADKQHRTVLEHALEKTIAGRPADVQLQARINFYRSQTQAVANKYEVTAERQAETGIER